IIIRGEWEEKPIQPENIGIVPIAFPLLVGPGAITTTILSLQNYGLIITLLSVLVVFIAVQIILTFIEPIYHFLGSSGTLVISKLMALLTAAIAIKYILNGIYYTLTYFS
ncbi:MAG: MarC family protein, partial [Candidatus Bathyarchaeia archaeon]